MAGALDRRRRDRGHLHVPPRMGATLLAALWAHLAACVLLMGSCCFLLLAGCPRTPTAFRWDERIAAWCRLLVLAAIFSGVVWLLARTAVFENRPDAALEARAVWHVVLDTWPGLVWLAGPGMLIVLGGFVAVVLGVTVWRTCVASLASWVCVTALG